MTLILPQRGRIRQAAAAGGALDADIDAGNITAIWSTRLVNPDYTGFGVRIRRNSDNARDSFGFDGNGDLDIGGIATFLGGGAGTVSAWFTQVGSADVSVEGSYPAYDASIAAFNSKPGIVYPGSGAGYHDTLSAVNLDDYFATDQGTLLAVLRQHSSSARNTIFRHAQSSTHQIILHADYDGTIYWDFGGNTSSHRTSVSSPGGWDDNPHAVACWRTTAGVQAIEIDGSITSETGKSARTSGQSAVIEIGGYISSANVHQGPAVEIVIAKTDLGSSVRAAWLAEVNEYWGL